MVTQELEQIVGNYNKVHFLSETLKEDTDNPRARSEAEEIVKAYLTESAMNDPDNKNLHDLANAAQAINFPGAPADVVRSYAAEADALAEGDIVGYVGDYLPGILSSMDKDTLDMLVPSIPAYKAKKNNSKLSEAHKAFAEAASTLRIAVHGKGEARDKANEKIASEVEKIINSNPFSESIFYNIRADPNLMESLYQNIVNGRAETLLKELKSKSKSDISAYLENYLITVKDEEKRDSYIAVANTAVSAASK